MNDYKTIRNIAEIEEYIGSAGVVSFDFETSPTEKYRSDGKAALDAHKADITGVSLSVKAGTGRYIPLRHRVGKNASLASVMKFLRQRVFQNPKTVKIAHNMAFEAMFLYKDGMILSTAISVTADLKPLSRICMTLNSRNLRMWLASTVLMSSTQMHGTPAGTPVRIATGRCSFTTRSTTGLRTTSRSTA